MAQLASTNHRNRPRVLHDAFIGAEVIFCRLFVDFLGDLLGRY